MKKLSRRDFLKASGYAFGAAVISTGLHGCLLDGDSDDAAEAVGVEFATPGVSSPGLEVYLGLLDGQAASAEQGFSMLVDDLQYADLNQRGYLLVTFTATEARADWQFVDTVKSRDYRLVPDRTRALRTLPGSDNRRLVET